MFSSTGFVVLIEGIVALGFGGFGLVLLLAQLGGHIAATASQNWPSVEGRIVMSRVHQVTNTSHGHTSHGMTSYMPDVKYTYSVMGNAYQGHRIGFGASMSGSESKARQVVALYSHDATCAVYYNPQNPAQAVLERKVQNNASALIVAIASLLIGIGLGLAAAGVIPLI